MKQIQSLRAVIVEKKREMGIELDRTEYFPKGKKGKALGGILKMRFESVLTSDTPVNLKSALILNERLMNTMEKTQCTDAKKGKECNYRNNVFNFSKFKKPFTESKAEDGGGNESSRERKP